MIWLLSTFASTRSSAITRSSSGIAVDDLGDHLAHLLLRERREVRLGDLQRREVDEPLRERDLRVGLDLDRAERRLRGALRRRTTPPRRRPCASGRPSSRPAAGTRGRVRRSASCRPAASRRRPARGSGFCLRRGDWSFRWSSRSAGQRSGRRLGRQGRGEERRRRRQREGQRGDDGHRGSTDFDTRSRHGTSLSDPRARARLDDALLLDAVAAPLEAGAPCLLERVLLLGVLGLGGLLRLDFKIPGMIRPALRPWTPGVSPGK